MKFVLILIAVVLVLLVVFSVIAPESPNNPYDPRPTNTRGPYNPPKHGEIQWQENVQFVMVV